MLELQLLVKIGGERPGSLISRGGDGGGVRKRGGEEERGPGRFLCLNWATRFMGLGCYGLTGHQESIKLFP